MERKLSTSYVPVFWTSNSTTYVYNVIENSNLFSEKSTSEGRYIDFESRNVINSHESRHDHLSSAEFGLYNKYKDINFAAMPENRISGNGDRFSQNEFPIETREDKKGCQNFS